MHAAFSFMVLDFWAQPNKHDFDTRGWLRVSSDTMTLILTTLIKVYIMCK